MITVLHRWGYAQMITILHRGEGSLGTPKSDYVICARPLCRRGNSIHYLYPSFFICRPLTYILESTQVFIKRSVNRSQLKWALIDCNPVSLFEQRLEMEFHMAASALRLCQFSGVGFSDIFKGPESDHCLVLSLRQSPCCILFKY